MTPHSTDYQHPSDIDALYDDRRDFCVIALTGYTGAGCSTLAQYMENSDFFKDASVRNPQTIGLKFPSTENNSDIYFSNLQGEVNSAIAKLNFKRKFTICKDFISNNYQPYKTLHYSWVLLLMAVMEIVQKSETFDAFKNGVAELIADKFRVSSLGVDDTYQRTLDELQITTGREAFFDGLREDEWINLHKEIQNLLYLQQNDPYQYKIELATVMNMTDGTQPSAFTVFLKKFNNWLFRQDYYCACFFYHRLGYLLRKCGSATVEYDSTYGKLDDFHHIYDVVNTINDIIKGIRHQKGDHQSKMPCRIVIDSVRNSLEARYLKERYSAFYMIAVHDEIENRKAHTNAKIRRFLGLDFNDETKNTTRLKEMIDKVWKIGEVEQENKDFEEGKFAAPNVERCVADAEIHIVNCQEIEKDVPIFNSMAEQWMKYASLIQHPGLITPSSEERCMVVAYTAKFNSGCLSRQVGAVITNAAHAIRTIGWNDVPYGQTPCGLRTVFDYHEIHAKRDDAANGEGKYVYSSFEKGGMIPRAYNNEGFDDKLIAHYKLPNPPSNYHQILKGLPFAYCFKSLHNKFEKVKNQVHTRALHAEENAILQMARFGGMPLENGIIYVTASPCELCCKKLYQIGVRKIVYIDEYPGISRENIISCGFKRPNLKQFQGAFGATYFKLYQPLMPYKEELSLRLKSTHKATENPVEIAKQGIKEVINKLPNLTEEEINGLNDFCATITAELRAKLKSAQVTKE
ncbi:hypothetical protein HDR69_04815 [bacterium]|nr:hypothetical protein [bacterium]